MISGGRPAIRFARELLLICCAGLGSIAVAQPVAPAEWGIQQLMHELSQARGDKARFVERRHIAILSKPLDSSGTLVYVAPDRLEKHTLAPRPESLVLEGDRLTLERPAESKGGSQRRTFALSGYPVIRALVESVRSTLAGDLATLNRLYQVGLEGGAPGWRLTLKPVEPGIREMVSEVRIGGTRGRIGTVEVVEVNGDRSLMIITRDAP